MRKRWTALLAVVFAVLLAAPSTHAMGIDFLGGASIHNPITAKIG